MSQLDALFDVLWRDYISLNPAALTLHRLLGERGEAVLNDHIALRTWDDPRVDIEVLAGAFVAAGYSEAGEYTFPAKKLRAKHYEHASRARPKVFISELRLGAFSDALRALVARFIDEIPQGATVEPAFCASGRHWKVSYAEYEALRAESEYAAWLAAFGFRANHFTVDVGGLKTFESLAELNMFVTQSGFSLNTSGGEIKGTPDVGLEQSSTLAERVSVAFAGGDHEIPSTYYEFAKRHVMADGERFEGFIASSADKIFESTDVQPAG